MEIDRRCVTLTRMETNAPEETGDELRGRQSEVPLAPLTTLELGGCARSLVTIEGVREAVEAAKWAQRNREPVTVLGGGSNIVVADDGVRGLVLKTALRGLDFRRDRGEVFVTAGAGEIWDDVVRDATARGLAGVECLAGIPGLVGATPIQNVGAYGQEVGDVVEAVRVLDLETFVDHSLTAAECRFGYRDSVFRRNPGRWLVLEVTYRLRPNGAPTLIYQEVERALAPLRTAPSLADVRDAVLDLRRSKSMVLDPGDPNRRSTGSFFVNPVVSSDGLADVDRRGRESGVLKGDLGVPSFDLGGGQFKVPAGWLIEKAGFRKGVRRGPVGISSAHALALVHHGGGTTAELVAFAREIRDGVQRAFGIELRPEPVFLGFESDNPLDN